MYWGKNSPFTLPLHRLISVHWQDVRSWLMDCVSVRYRTVPVVWSWPVSCTVVYHCKLFKIKTINREYSFYPQGGCGGQKNFLLPALTPSWWHHFPAKERGCITFEFPGWNCRLFIISIGIRGARSKTIKTGLNCWHFYRLWHDNLGTR